MSFHCNLKKYVPLSGKIVSIISVSLFALVSCKSETDPLKKITTTDRIQLEKIFTCESKYGEHLDDPDFCSKVLSQIVDVIVDEGYLTYADIEEGMREAYVNYEVADRISNAVDNIVTGDEGIPIDVRQVPLKVEEAHLALEEELGCQEDFGMYISDGDVCTKFYSEVRRELIKDNKLNAADFEVKLSSLYADYNRSVAKRGFTGTSVDGVENVSFPENIIVLDDLSYIDAQFEALEGQTIGMNTYITSNGTEVRLLTDNRPFGSVRTEYDSYLVNTGFLPEPKRLGIGRCMDTICSASIIAKVHNPLENYGWVVLEDLIIHNLAVPKKSPNSSEIIEIESVYEVTSGVGAVEKNKNFARFKNKFIKTKTFITITKHGVELRYDNSTPHPDEWTYSYSGNQEPTLANLDNLAYEKRQKIESHCVEKVCEVEILAKVQSIHINGSVFQVTDVSF